MLAVLATHNGHDHGLAGFDIVAALIVLLFACLVAAVVFVGCRSAGRPDIGGLGACGVLIAGAIIALLVAV